MVTSPLETELKLEEIKDLNSHYKYVKSKCSCKVSDIEGFTYGGMTSRFWIYRKHLLSMTFQDIKESCNFPFYPWECITLQLKNRDLDLVIRNDDHMKCFIRFLIHVLNTVDGNRDSAQGIYQALYNQEVAEKRK